MDATRDAGEAAREAYEAVAAAYDAFTAGYAHGPWLGALVALAEAHGLTGRRALDVACGTGKSFLPLLERGFAVTGCDVSPGMLERARAKAPGVRLEVADMRALPDLGEFDLVTCLDDALNYLATEEELLAALRGLRASLAPDGVALWDVNTPAMYRGAFARTWAVEDEERLVLWRGGVRGGFAAGDRAHAVIDVFEVGGAGWRRTTSRHDQRHWPAPVVSATARAAGLEVTAVLGQHTGARLEPALDEAVHPKALFVARRDDREVRRMRIGSP